MGSDQLALSCFLRHTQRELAEYTYSGHVSPFAGVTNGHFIDTLQDKTHLLAGEYSSGVSTPETSTQAILVFARRERQSRTCLKQR